MQVFAEEMLTVTNTKKPIIHVANVADLTSHLSSRVAPLPVAVDHDEALEGSHSHVIPLSAPETNLSFSRKRLWTIGGVTGSAPG